MIRLFYIILVALLFCSTASVAQKSDCEQTLRTAQEEFNAGHFFGLPAILEPCMKSGFTKEQRQRANLLLVQTYLLLDDPASAEKSYLELLKANPEFVTDVARDPIDVVYLSKKFTSSPIFTLFGKVGPNISPVRVVKSNSPYQSTNQVAFNKKYFLVPGWQFSLGTDVRLKDYVNLSASVQFMSSAYQCNTYNSFGRDRSSFTDKQFWFNVPLSVKFTINDSKFKPYVFGGYSANILLSDKANIRYTDVLGVGDASQSISVQNLNILFKRNKLNHAFFFGGGLKRKIGLNYVYADVRYSLGLNNIINTKNIYATSSSNSHYGESNEILMRYGHVDDFLRLDNLSISIGYQYPLYKPRKLKKANTKAVIKKIRKQNSGQHDQ